MRYLLLLLLLLGGFAISIENCFQSLQLMNTFTISFMVIRFLLLINYYLVFLFAYEVPIGPDERVLVDFYDPPAFGESSLNNPVTSPDKFVSFEHRPPSISSSIKRNKRKAKRRALYMMGGNVVSLLCFGLSIVTGIPWARCIIWLFSFIFDFGIHLWVTRSATHVPFKGSHLPERMGLFTIIVLGECIIVMLETAAQWVVTFSPGLKSGSQFVQPVGSLLETLLLGSSFIVICYCFWWMYFDDFCNAVMQFHQKRKHEFLYDRVRSLWIFLHLPHHTALAVMGMLIVDAITYVDVFRYKALLSINNTTQLIERLIESRSPYYYTFFNVYEGYLEQQLVLWFGIIFLLNAIIKFLNTYRNEGKLSLADYI